MDWPDEPTFGWMSHDKGQYGFITMDDGATMFVMPAQCEAFGKVFPPIGTEVMFSVVLDGKTGRPRAQDVRPADSSAITPASWDGLVGVLSHDKGAYGFITLPAPLEDGATTMFVMPAQCQSFGGVFPPIGTEVAFDVVTDAKTGRPRAENVRAQASPGRSFGTARAHPYAKGGNAQGKVGMSYNASGKGFAKADGKVGKATSKSMASGKGMLALPSQPFGKGKSASVPSKGLSKSYGGMAWSSKGSYSPTAGAHAPQKGLTRGAGASVEGMTMTGVMTHDKGLYGFITLEDGVQTMFVMPMSCDGFEGAFPPIGTEVIFEVITDQKTGRPRAENVRPRAEAEVASEGETLVGVMTHDKGQYGFITLEDGVNTMFAMPFNCQAFGEAFPPIGTEVMFEVVTDSKTGRPRAENVRPIAANGAGYAAHSAASATFEAEASSEGETMEGTMTHDKGKYGFITLQDGVNTMFVMPLNCEGFGKAFPPIGTEVMFEVITDSKTGKPRASNVRPLEDVPEASKDARERSRSPRRARPSRAASPLFAGDSY